MSLDSVKVMEDWQSNRSNELYKRNKKKKKKNNVRNSDGQEEEANGGCWVKLRVMLCCVASTSDVHSSLSLSTTTGMQLSSKKGLSFWDAIFLILVSITV